MIRIRIVYSSEEEKEKLINAFKSIFKIRNISKEYKKEGPYKKIYLDLSEK